jgi:outer membrane protein TolC
MKSSLKSSIVAMLFFYGLLFFLRPAIAQEQVTPLVVGIEDAMRLAMELNPTLKVAELEIERANTGINIVRGRYLPNISASGGYTRNIKKPVIFLPPGSPFGDVLEIGSDNSYSTVLAAGMPVYNPALNAALRAARVEREIAGEDLRASKIELEYFVHSAFYDALLAKESMEVMEQSFRNAQENLELVRRMQQQGLAAEFDLIRAQVQTENLRPTLLQAQNGYKMAVNYLKALIGLETNQYIELLGNLTQVAEQSMTNFSIQQANRSLNKNADLVKLNLQMNLIDKQAQSIRASALPSVSFGSNYNFQTEANDFKIADYNWVRTFAAGLRFNIPVFSGFTVRNQAKQFDILGEQMALQRDYLAENLSLQIDNILNTMLVAVEKSNTTQATVEMAERGYKISRVRYDTGQGTLLEVNDSELAFTQARFNLLQAKHELLKAQAEYKKFIGESK